MNLWIFVDDTGRVSASQLSDKPMPSPWIDTHLTEYPQPPNADEANGIFYEMAWRNGKIVWDAVKTDYREPPTEEPTEPTNEEISALRQTAYEAECDKLLIASLGYTAEGDTAKAESARRAYLKAKAEVRARLPYNE